MKSSPNPVDWILSLLGPNTVLLSWPWGTKGVPRRWNHISLKHMSDPAYLKKLGEGNIGVVQGKKSGDLCSVDLDDNELMERFFAECPELTKTLISIGARGCNLWFHINGPYPGVFKFKDAAGRDAGEFRSNGAQTIIWGRHPSGKDYEIRNAVPPLAVTYADLTAAMLKVGIDLHAQSNLSEETEESEDTEVSEDSDGTEVILGELCGVDIKGIHDVVVIATPTGPHENNACLFRLARGIKYLEQAQGRAWSQQEKQEAFELWYKANPHLRPGQSKEDYEDEFFAGYARAKFPLGGLVLLRAFQAAIQKAFPPEAEQFSNPRKKLLVALCKELQILAGDKPFFLSARSFESLVKDVSRQTVRLWLDSLVGRGILRIVTPGNQKKAHRYSYLPLVEARKRK